MGTACALPRSVNSVMRFPVLEGLLHTLRPFRAAVYGEQCIGRAIPDLSGRRDAGKSAQLEAEEILAGGTVRLHRGDGHDQHRKIVGLLAPVLALDAHP